MSITLLAPPELGISPAVDRPELLLRGRMILGDLLADGATGAADEARRLSEALLCDGTRALSGDFETGTLLRAQAIRELDEYLLIERVSARSPGEVLLSSLLEAGCSYSFLKSYGSLHAEQDLRLRRGLAAMVRCFDPDGPREEDNREPLLSSRTLERSGPTSAEELLEIWRRGHWVFFVLTQGLIVTMRRLHRALLTERWGMAELQLEDASRLFWACGAAMRITGSFTKAQYLGFVRRTMTFGDDFARVKNQSLSGTMTWDHHYLVHALWRKHVAHVLGNAPASLNRAREDFVLAYKEGLADGHRAVCSKFGGQEMGSLVVPDTLAIDTINAIDTKRIKQLGGPDQG